MLVVTAIFLFCLTVLSSAELPAATYLNGNVTHVPDGDTLHILTAAGETEKLRLYAIDCPEIAQPHGAVARGYTHSLTIGRQITALVQDVDRYG
jgi:endonuclease YncB( thermonuclease family)